MRRERLSEVARFMLLMLVLASSAVTSSALAVGHGDNKAPVCETVQADALSVHRGVSVNLRVRAADPNGYELTYKWTASSGTLKVDGAIAILDTTWARLGECTVTVVISNGHGNTTECNAVIEIRDWAARPN